MPRRGAHATDRLEARLRFLACGQRQKHAPTAPGPPMACHRVALCRTFLISPSPPHPWPAPQPGCCLHWLPTKPTGPGSSGAFQLSSGVLFLHGKGEAAKKKPTSTFVQSPVSPPNRYTEAFIQLPKILSVDEEGATSLILRHCYGPCNSISGFPVGQLPQGSPRVLNSFSFGVTKISSQVKQMRGEAQAPPPLPHHVHVAQCPGHWGRQGLRPRENAAHGPQTCSPATHHPPWAKVMLKPAKKGKI